MDRSVFHSTVQIHAQMLAARALLFAVLPNIISGTSLEQRQGIIDRLTDQANEIPPMANPSHPDETEVYEKTVEVVHEEITRLADGLRQAFGLNETA